MPRTSRLDVDDARLQRLAAAEGEQLAGQLAPRSTPASALPTRRCAARCRATSRCRSLQVAADHLQQVVEVVRDAAGELADRLHLLRLANDGLGLQPPRDVERRDDEAATGIGLR